MKQRIGIILVYIFFIALSCSRDLPDGRVGYVELSRRASKMEKTIEPNSVNWNLTISSTIDLYAMMDSVGFANFFLYCPIDGDFKNYRKDSIFYLRDDCFACDNVKVVKKQQGLLYTIPVMFITTIDKNAVPFKLDELDMALNRIDSCLECRIVFTQLPGKTRMTNSFCIPKDVLIIKN